MQKTHLQLCLLIVTVMSMQAQSLRAQAASVPNAIFQFFADSLIAAMSTEYKIPGCAVAITDHGKVVYQSTYGYINVEKKVPVAPDSRFRLGSVTKMFTAMAIMQLVEQGKVDLEAPVEQYIPDLKIKQLKPGNPVRIRHLLTHTSGFTDDVFNYSYGSQAPPQQTLVALASEEILSIEPGYIFNYSNVGYGLLGVVIERVSGLSYAEYTERYLFRPLGLRATAAYYNVPTDEKVALGYNAKGTRVDEPLIRDIAAGGVLSTIEDLVMLQQALANPEILEQSGVLRRATFEMMCTPQTSNLTLATDEKFGLGLFIVPLGVKDDHLIGDGVGHGGDFSFHHALTMVFPKAQLGISIVFTGEDQNNLYNALLALLLRKYYAVSRNAEGTKSNPDKTFSALGLQNERIDHREINGVYGGGGSGYIRLKRVNEQKIRFLQGKHRLLLKRNDATNRYYVRYKLLRLIPIKVKDMEFAFLKVDDRIVLKACYPGICIIQGTKCAWLAQNKPNITIKNTLLMSNTPFSFKTALAYALNLFLTLSLLSLMDSPSQWIDFAKKYLLLSIGAGLLMSFVSSKFPTK